MTEILNKLKSIFKIGLATDVHVDRPIGEREERINKILKDYEQIEQAINSMKKSKEENNCVSVDNSNDNTDEEHELFRGKAF